MKERGMMLQPQRLIQLPLIGVILLCLLAITYLIARKRSSKPGPAATIIKHTVDTSSDDALKYWTADRMRKAKGAKMPHVDALDQEKKHPQGPPQTSDPHHA
jgi:hypothetical protein